MTTVSVDANMFLRVIAAPSPDADPRLAGTAAALFRAAGSGEIEFTTSEAVVAEIVWVLTRAYKFDRTEIANRLSPLLGSPGCVMPTRQNCVDALRMWATLGSVSFVDVLLAVTAERSNHQLATLDEDLARLSIAPRWMPDAPAA